MMLLIGVGCLFAGALIGALIHKLLLSDSVRVKQLEAQLQSLSDEHEQYRSRVHSHFSDSAQLLDQLTESYRDVYLHMADAARTLCPDYISNQLRFDRNTRDLLDQDKAPQPEPIPVPPAAAAPIAAAAVAATADEATATPADMQAASPETESALEQDSDTTTGPGTEPAPLTEPSADATADTDYAATADATLPADPLVAETTTESATVPATETAPEFAADPAQEPGADTNPELANESSATNPPLDYAPKSTPDQKGSLAEDYGLDQRDSAKQS